MKTARRPVAVVAGGVIALLAACSPGGADAPIDVASSPAENPAASAEATDEPSPLWTPEPTEVELEPVVLDCYDDERGDRYVTRDDGTRMRTDFKALWPSEYDMCDTWRP